MTATLSPPRPRAPKATADPVRSAVPVLLVDDNAAKRLALKVILSPLGYRVVEADSGMAALRSIMADDFAVILLDVRMPEMDGFETAALIRQRQQSEMTPIIFITAYASDEFVLDDRYVEGAVDFMFAPVLPHELRAKVSVFANIFTRAQSLAEHARTVQVTADQLRLLTDAAPIGIFQTNADNRYLYTNPRWSEITGISLEEAEGREWEFIIGADQRAEGVAGIAYEPDLCRKFTIRRSDFDLRTVVVTSNAIIGKGGSIGGWVGTLADVTAEAQAEAAMTTARDAALLASKMQQNFAASASHELRTPTSSIIGFVEEILENDAVSEEDRGFLDIVYRNAQRLSQLIDDLLILGQAEFSESMMSPEPTPVAALVERVLSMLSATAQRADIALSADHELELPDAMIDPLRLEQALANVVSNAIKFTPSGGAVTVSTRCQAGAVEIEVMDTGVGISPDDLARIFDRFFRAHGNNNEVKGSGLGLAIAAQMVKAQHGRIDVSSVVGTGSTFTITLPIVPEQ